MLRVHLQKILVHAVFCCLVAGGMSACTVYKPEHQQGNLLNVEQIAKLQVGLPKSQVLLILGSPLLEDVFHAHRWEYVYRQIKGEKTLQQQMLTVEFDSNGKLSKWSSMTPNHQP